MNKDLVVKMEKYLADLETDKKTIVMDSKFDFTYLANWQDEIIKIDEFKIDRIHANWYLRNKFLSILFIKEKKKKIDKYCNLLWTMNDDIDYSLRVPPIKFKLETPLLDIESKKKDIGELDSNDIYLYSDIIGKVIADALEKVNNPKQVLIETLDLLTEINNKMTINRYFVLLIFVSLIKKEGYKNSKLEEMEEKTNLYELIDFIVNSNFEDDYYIEKGKTIIYDCEKAKYSDSKYHTVRMIQVFQSWIKEGYLFLQPLKDVIDN